MENSQPKESCCAAVNNAIGTYYTNQAASTRIGSALLSEIFAGDQPALTARSLLIFGFLQTLNIAILEKFASFKLCKDNCCQSAALAVQQIGNAYTDNIITAVASTAFSLAELQQVIVALVTGYTNALNSIILKSKCGDRDGCCRRK